MKAKMTDNPKQTIVFGKNENSHLIVYGDHEDLRAKEATSHIVSIQHKIPEDLLLHGNYSDEYKSRIEVWAASNFKLNDFADPASVEAFAEAFGIGFDGRFCNKFFEEEVPT